MPWICHMWENATSFPIWKLSWKGRQSKSIRNRKKCTAVRRVYNIINCGWNIAETMVFILSKHPEILYPNMLESTWGCFTDNIYKNTSTYLTKANLIYSRAVNLFIIYYLLR